MCPNEDDEGVEDLLAPLCDPRLARNGGIAAFEALPDNPSDVSKRELLESVRKELLHLAKTCQSHKEAILLPDMARSMLRCLWANDSVILCLLVPMLSAAAKHYEFPTDVFFMEAILLSPSICRLPRHVGGLAFEHPETALYARVVRRAMCMSHIVDFIEQQQHLDSSSNEGTLTNPMEYLPQDPDGNLFSVANVNRADGALKLAYILLQAAVNGIYDCNAAVIPAGLESKVGTVSRTNTKLPGLRQRLEKKEGLFRMHMMGKRVNYTCRSVISPDPNLDVTEVGIPLFFALRLTFPAPVNTLNLKHLRQLVSNGPDNYPGARSILTPEGQLIHLPPGNTPHARKKCELLARRLTAVPANPSGIPFIVNRHLLDGDFLVMNRQPTLHKPSMQAHRVRIIHSSSAKTLRMHYSNCRAYNADFDGDEMNGHLPQSHAAQAELELLASVPHHYLGPKDGAPLAGLIQDHVIAAVKLTMRDRFLTYPDYLELVYHALRSLFTLSQCSLEGPPKLLTLKPAIMWPQRLWTGKQVISTLLINLTPLDMPHLNCTLQGRRTKAELWSGVEPGKPTPLSDVDVVVCDGYLVSGILDKSHIGSSSGGLVHCVYESYGPEVAAHLLNGISLMANRFLRLIAFTMGIKDMLLSCDADRDRARRFSNMKDLGLCAFADAFELDPDALSEPEVRHLYRQAHFAPATQQNLGRRLMQLDNAMKTRLKRAQDAVCDAAIPSGLYVRFPENNLQLMVHVGAKGGMVNTQQMSVALGQIELEGRRVPLMLSGRTLPSFPMYDIRPRAGGMCTHRFLTALPPQELFFHSMAGRDGLVDTAVKTSRSGYLQRSAVKHLEDLSIQYDGTVRDSGQNVVQFRYGDDGVDVCQASFLQPSGLHLFADNAAVLAMRWRSFHQTENSSTYQQLHQVSLPRPLQIIADQVGTQRQLLLLKAPSQSKITKMFRKYRLVQNRLSENSEHLNHLSRSELLNAELPDPPCDVAAALRELCVAKLISAQAPPGEPVGLLAAQSVGEPSTQMTLNTFHFAGRGEMNVTLGIPRMREILMSGSASISTPCIEVPVRPTIEAHRGCFRLAKRFYRLKLTEVIRLPLNEAIDYASDSYTLEFQLEPPSAYSDRSYFRPAKVLRFLERIFFPDFAKRLDRELKDQGKTTLIRSFALSALARQQKLGAADGSADPLNDEDRAGAERDAGGRTQTVRACDEWNEDDGHEAVRRRRLETEAEEDGMLGRSQPIDLDDLVDLVVDDDDEAAELRELGVDPDKADKDADEASDHEDPDSGPHGADKGSKKSRRNTKTNVLGSVDEVEIDGPSHDYAEADLDEVVSHSQSDAEVNSNDENVDEFEIESRQTFVTRLHARFSKYEFDRSDPPTWARLTICMFDPKDGRISIDLKTLVMRLINRCVVSSVPGIEKVAVDRSSRQEWMFRVEGTNIVEIMRYPGVFDINRLYTNNISLMYQTYGIEAARAAIQKEVSSVFGHYGIYVNPRHLSLVADYMTKSGFYRAFNRSAFAGHPSPLQQMSFETVSTALKDAIQDDRVDTLVSPSASLITGRIVHNAGTTCFGMYQRLPY
ncbi:unnamed protein product [Dicrocoelium dendriticum]|nr:unnamed protein product [Dicrocoelium dendriticum]